MAKDRQYITERLLPSFIRDICTKHGLAFTSFSDEWILRIEKKIIRKWVIGYSFDINSTAASQLARDKVASYLAFESDGVPAIEHYLARSRASKKVLINNVLALKPAKPVVIKPLEGASGHGVHYFAKLVEAIHYLNTQPHTDWAISPWYDIKSEMRLIMLDDSLLLAYEKTEPVLRDGLLFYNLGLGAVAVDIKPEPQVLTIAKHAMRSTGLRLAAVDIAHDIHGNILIVEINEGIMMEHYSRQSKENMIKTSKVYQQIIAKMFEDT